MTGNAQKHTLLQAAEATPQAKLAREYVFRHPEKIVSKNFPTLQKNKKRKRTVLNLTDTASIVKSFVENLCELQADRLRTDSKAAANIRLKEILKKGALTVKRTVVHLTNSCGYTNSRASNPPFLKLL